MVITQRPADPNPFTADQFEGFARVERDVTVDAGLLNDQQAVIVIDGEIHLKEAEPSIIARPIRSTADQRLCCAVIFWSSNGKHVDLNLETLKGEILNYLAASNSLFTTAFPADSKSCR